MTGAPKGTVAKGAIAIAGLWYQRSSAVRGAVQQGMSPGPWTRGEVEARLVAAFRAMPACPVYGRPGRLRPVEGGAGDRLAALAWVDLLDDDPGARKILWAWARCRATGESFAALCREMGWKAPTAEAARRRAATAIAAALNEAPAPIGCADQA